MQILKKSNNILIIGGDNRQIHMAKYLKEKGFDVSLYGLPSSDYNSEDNLKNEVMRSDIIIFPLPVTKDGKNICSTIPVKENIDEIISFIDNNKIIFGGIIGKGIENKLNKKNIRFYDYFQREELTLKNTVPTVQGILKVIIENVDYTINSSETAVFGYGRVAKITADTLSAIGAKVTVCARKNSDLVNADIKGLKSCKIKDFNDISKNFDIIINTIPDLVIDRNILVNVKKECLIIDVSSAPFGIDFAAANELGIKALQCPSLPGKVAPKTAGIIIAETITDILKEENLWKI